MKKFLSLLVATVLCLTSPVNSQTLALPSPGPAVGVGGGVLLYKGAKTCAKHPILCGMAGTAVIVGGGAIVAKTRKKHQPKDDCPAGYLDLFRVVSRYELADIEIFGRYQHGINSLGSKEFWLKFEDALWFADDTKHFAGSEKGLYIVTSLACRDTIALSHPFGDAGSTHIGYAFEGSLLEKVNVDAQNTKGIRLVREMKW